MSGQAVAMKTMQSQSTDTGPMRRHPTITGPQHNDFGRIIQDNHHSTHRRVQHFIARLKDWRILRQCGRSQAINHSIQIIAGLWNIKTHNQLRINS